MKNNSCNLWQWLNEFVVFTFSPGSTYYIEFLLVSMLAMTGVVMSQSHDSYTVVIGMFTLVQSAISFNFRLLMPFIRYERSK